MASDITYYLNVYPFPLTGLMVEAGDECAFSAEPIYTPVSSTCYSVEFSLIFGGTASPSVVVSADGYQSQTVALESSGGTVNVTLEAETPPLPEIECVQLGGQTYALRDNRVDDIQATIPDYSAGTSISAPTATAPFTATQNCRVLIGIKYIDSGGDTVDIYIDDHHVGGVVARYYNIHFVPIDLKAGSVLKLIYNNADTFLRAYVFPFIGA